MKKIMKDNEYSYSRM